MQLSTPGLRTVTASVFDSSANVGSASIKVGLEPVPPDVRIVLPSEGTQVFQGLPTALFAELANRSLASQPPCEDFTWSAFHDNQLILPNTAGACPLLRAFNVQGTVRIDAGYSDATGSGGAQRFVEVVNDGKPHVFIVSPAVVPDLITDEPIANVDVRTPILLDADAVPIGLPFSYTWTVQIGTDAAIVVGSTEQVPWTFPVFIPNCGHLLGTITVQAVDALEQVTTHSIKARFAGKCDPF